MGSGVESGGVEGITCFIVPRDTPGLEVGKKENNMWESRAEMICDSLLKGSPERPCILVQPIMEEDTLKGCGYGPRMEPPPPDPHPETSAGPELPRVTRD